MTDRQREDALEEEAVEYADAKVRAGIWSREEALDRSHAEIRGLVGARPEERGHEFFVGVDASGDRVGWIWLGPVPTADASPSTRWLYQMVVDASLRGRGFGRGLLRAAEGHLLVQGRMEIALNVFRWNSAAVALYASSGYDVAFQDDRALEMRKRLRPA